MENLFGIRKTRNGLRCFCPRGVSVTEMQHIQFHISRKKAGHLAMPCASVTTLGYKSNAIMVGNQIVQCGVATEKEKLLS